MAQKLYRNNKDKIIAGVCSGLAEYLNIDPVIVRIIALGLFFMHGFGLLTYIIAWVIIPPKFPDDNPEVKEPKITHASGSTKIIVGAVLIVFGALIALDKSFYYTRFVGRLFDLTWEYFIPLALIIAGVFILIQGKKDTDKDKKPGDFT
ncbi:MAG: PspC domain-containing protein [Candidatus Marinimicrobia bacterium]|nr:PspC domain-containing protein [Candidatus Neomarinimicrobiota bacterium]